MPLRARPVCDVPKRLNFLLNIHVYKPKYKYKNIHSIAFQLPHACSRLTTKGEREEGSFGGKGGIMRLLR